jgi:hypothetical protein
MIFLQLEFFFLNLRIFLLIFCKISKKGRKKTLKNEAWFDKSKRQLAISETGSEYREDYTVKTFKGHIEGVLCVAGNALL